MVKFAHLSTGAAIQISISFTELRRDAGPLDPWRRRPAFLWRTVPPVSRGRNGDLDNASRCLIYWWRTRDSNPGPKDYDSSALTS